MRKKALETVAAISILIVAAAPGSLSARYRPGGTYRQAPKATTATYSSVVYAAPPTYAWIQIKFGPGKDDFFRPQIVPTTSIFENGRPAPKSALCPTPAGSSCGNVRVQVTGYYYGAWQGLSTKFYATRIIILGAGSGGSASPPSASGYHPPAAAYHPPAGQPTQAVPSGQAALTGTIQALRSGYFELAVTGRAPLWVRDIGASITQSGRMVGPNLLRAGESVQVQGRIVGAQLWATEVLIVPSPQAAGSAAPAGRAPASSGGSQLQTAPKELTAQQETQLTQRARQDYLAYQAKFQMQQVDRHIASLNSLMRDSSCGAGCQTLLQNQLAGANQVKLNLSRSMQPIQDLGRQLVNFIPPREFSSGPGVRPRGGTVNQGGSSGSGPVCTAPQIASLSPNQGQPNDPILINGSALTNAINPQVVPTANLILNGQTYVLNVQGWSGSQIVVSVPPTISGIQAVSGYINVTTCEQSNQAPFQFIPQTTMQQLPIEASEASFAGFGCGIDNCGSSSGIYMGVAEDSIHGGAVTGRRGDDQFFYGYQLKNGWVLDSVNFQPGSPPNSGNGCQVSGGTGAVGSASPYVDIHCWVSPGHGQASYSLEINIHGPDGVPYQ